MKQMGEDIHGVFPVDSGALPGRDPSMQKVHNYKTSPVVSFATASS